MEMFNIYWAVIKKDNKRVGFLDALPIQNQIFFINYCSSKLQTYFYYHFHLWKYNMADYTKITMNSFDLLFSNPLERVIITNLGKKTVKKIGDRLFEKYGISLSDGIRSYDKLHDVLEEFFGTGSTGLEKKILQQIVEVEYDKSGFYVKIKDSKTNLRILGTIGDPDKKAIMDCASAKPKTIYQILEETGLPQTSCYRKIKQMIEDGILIRNGIERTQNGKVKSKYISAITNMKINIKKNKVFVDAILNDKPENSLIVQTICH